MSDLTILTSTISGMEEFIETMKNDVRFMENFKVDVYILPFTKTLYQYKNMEEEEIINIFVKNTQTKFISNFETTIYQETTDTLSELIMEILDKQTFGAIKVKKEMLEESSHCVSWVEDDLILKLFVFFNLGDTYESDCLYIVKSFVENFKLEIKSQTDMSLFSSNLIYMSAVNLYELCKGDVYTVEDEDGNKSNYNVSDGMLIDEEIMELYKPSKGDIPVNQFLNTNSTCPSEIAIYDSISETFSSDFMKIMDSCENVFF